jgi:hypothetical protein
MTKGKEYKTLFQIFVGRQIVRHDENLPARTQTTIVALRLETIRRQAKAATLGFLANSGSKRSKAS